MLVLSFFLSPPEIIILLMIGIIGTFIYFIVRAKSDIKKTGGSSCQKTTKWILIILTFLISFILFSMNILGQFSIIVLVAGLGAIVGIARHKPESQDLKIPDDNNTDIRNV